MITESQLNTYSTSQGLDKQLNQVLKILVHNEISKSTDVVSKFVNANVKITSDMEAEFRKLKELGVSYYDIASMYDVSYFAVYSHINYGIKEYHAEYYHKIKTDTILLLGGKCDNCNIQDLCVLNINHKNGGGGVEKKETDPTMFYLDILKGRRKTSDINVLCHNCNILYEYEVGRRKEDSPSTSLHNFTVSKLGGKCTKCGNNDLRVLEINHINRDGYKERTKFHGDMFYHSIIDGTRSTNDINILCGNCNSAYTYESTILNENHEESVLRELSIQFPTRSS